MCISDQITLHKLQTNLLTLIKLAFFATSLQIDPPKFFLLFLLSNTFQIFFALFNLLYNSENFYNLIAKY